MPLLEWSRANRKKLLFYSIVYLLEITFNVRNIKHVLHLILLPQLVAKGRYMSLYPVINIRCICVFDIWCFLSFVLESQNKLMFLFYIRIKKRSQRFCGVGLQIWNAFFLLFLIYFVTSSFKCLNRWLCPALNIFIKVPFI